MAQYRYPNDLSTNNASFITFTFLKFNGIITTEKLRRINDQNNFLTTARGGIALPVPNNLQDSLGINYGSLNDTSTLSLSADQWATNIASKGSSKLLGDKITSGGLFAQQTVQGSSQNAMMFESVGNKSYTLSWDFIPQSLADAQQLENIVKEFRLASLPYRTDKLEFYHYPDLVKVKIGGVNSSLIRFLPAVITAVDFSPTPDGYYQIYNSGHFPKMNLSISITEIVSRTQEIQSNIDTRDWS